MPLALLVALALGSDYKLVFSDEFDQPGRVDGTKWGYEMGFVRNRELQWYQRSNVFVENGICVIEGRREPRLNPNYDPNVSGTPVGGAARPQEDWRRARQWIEYTSGALDTKGLHSWLYGRFEIRAKIVPHDGLWPAIWFVGDTHPWPSNGEIDLMEYYQQKLHANTAYGYGAGIWDSVAVPMKEFYEKDKDWASKFHIWRMDWDAHWIRLYVDDRLMNETDISNTRNKDGFNPFHQKQHMILNLAIGSTAGSPAKEPFPSRFEIDYVRVYQKQ